MVPRWNQLIDALEMKSTVAASVEHKQSMSVWQMFSFGWFENIKYDNIAFILFTEWHCQRATLFLAGDRCLELPSNVFLSLWAEESHQ